MIQTNANQQSNKQQLACYSESYHNFIIAKKDNETDFSENLTAYQLYWYQHEDYKAYCEWFSSLSGKEKISLFEQINDNFLSLTSFEVQKGGQA